MFKLKRPTAEQTELICFWNKLNQGHKWCGHTWIHQNSWSFLLLNPLSLTTFPNSVNIATVHQDGPWFDPSSLHFFTTTSDLCVSYLHPTTGYSVLFSPCLHPGLNLLISCLPCNNCLQILVSFLLPMPRYNPLSREQLDFNVILAFSATLKHGSSFLWFIGRQNSQLLAVVCEWSTSLTSSDTAGPTLPLTSAPRHPSSFLPQSLCPVCSLCPHNLPPEHEFASCTPFRS